MSEPTLRDALNQMPEGDFKNCYEVGYVLSLLSIAGKTGQPIDADAWRKTVSEAASKLLAGLDGMAGSYLANSGHAALRREVMKVRNWLKERERHRAMHSITPPYADFTIGEIIDRLDRALQGHE